MRRAAAAAVALRQRWRLLECRIGALGGSSSCSNSSTAAAAGSARPFANDAAPPPRYPRRPSCSRPGADPYAWIRTADPRDELGRYLAQESRLYRAADLSSGGAPAARLAIERADAASQPSFASPSSSSSPCWASGVGRPEPSGPYEYWPRASDGPQGGMALKRRRRRRRSEDKEATTTEEVVVLSSADVRADAALAARRLFKRRRLLQTPGMAAEDLFGPDFDQHPPDVRLSRDHALVAYLLPYAPSAPAPEGSALLVVRSLAAAEDAPKRPALPPLAMVRAVTGAEFSPWFDRGDPSVYYVEPDVETGRPARVRRRSVSVGAEGSGGEENYGGGGGGLAEDTLLYDEPDPRFFVALTRTKDWRALAVNSHSKVSSEVRLLMRRGQSEEGGRPTVAAAAEALATQTPTTLLPPPPPSLMLVARRRPEVEYFVEHWRGRVLVLTNAPELFLAAEGRAAAAGGPAVAAAAAADPAAAPPFHSSSARGRDYALLAAPVVDCSDGTAASPWRLGPFVELAPEPHGRCSFFASAAAGAGSSGDDDDDDDGEEQQEEIAATTDMDVFDAGVVLHQRDAAGRPALSVVVVAAGANAETAAAAAPPSPPVLLRAAGLPRWALELEPAANQDPSSAVFRFDLSSPARPPRPFEMDLATGAVRPSPPTDGPMSSSSSSSLSLATAADARPTSRLQTRHPAPPLRPDLVCRRVIVPCLPGDGHDEGVPLTLLHRRPRPGDGASSSLPPARVALLEAYGAYGRPLEAGWRADRAALALGRGWVVALAHARGGGELGRRWHRAGRGSRKGRSARDVLACARWLVREGGLARPAGGIALCGASAGGVAAAGALLLEPALFGAAVLEVPFVDALAEMEGGASGDGAGAGAGAASSSSSSAAALDLLAQHEVDEWGDDDDEDGDDNESGRAATFRALERGACPYQALLRMARRGERDGAASAPALPPLLLTAAADDARVRLQGVVRFAALYRDVLAAAAAAECAGAAGSRAPPMVLVRVAAGGGHFGGGSAAGDAEEVTEHHEFVSRAMQGGRED